MVFNMLKETVKQIINKWENWEFQQNIPKLKLERQRDRKNELDGYYKNYKPQKLNLINQEGRVTEAEGRISDLYKKS